MNWKILWLDPLALLPGAFDCFVNFLLLSLDPVTGRSRPAHDKVEVRAKSGFGSAISVLPLGERYSTFGPLVPSLKAAGYEEGVDLFSHPYDFRYDDSASVMIFGV